MIWYEKQTNDLRGHNCFMTEGPALQKTSQSICRENLLTRLCNDKYIHYEIIKIIWNSVIFKIVYQMFSNV